MSITTRKTIRNDGYMNILSGLGSPAHDRTVLTGMGVSSWQRGLARFWTSRFHMMDLGEVYFNSGLAQKIIDRPADDCFQRGINIEGDDDGVMLDEFDRLQVLTRFADAIRWSRLYGASCLVLIAKDGGELTDPLNLDALDEITEIRVFDITCVRNDNKYYDDRNDPEHFGKIEFYKISAPGQQPFDIHESRLIPVGGDPVPVGYISQSNIPWAGRPTLEGCYKSLMRYDNALEWTLRLLERKQQAVYNMEGLGEAIANQEDHLVTNRINMVDMVRGILNSVVIDKEDTYQIQNLGIEGIQNVLDEYQVSLSADSNIPLLVLFGKTHGGLQTSAQSNMESYYSMVSHIQQVLVKPAMERLVAVLYTQATIKAKTPDKWKIIFNALWMPSEQEQATTRKDKTVADQNEVGNLINLMNNGILSAEEVRQVIVNDIYNEFEFSDTLPSSGGDIDYAEGIDTSMLTVSDPARTQQ